MRLVSSRTVWRSRPPSSGKAPSARWRRRSTRPWPVPLRRWCPAVGSCPSWRRGHGCAPFPLARCSRLRLRLAFAADSVHGVSADVPRRQRAHRRREPAAVLFAVGAAGARLPGLRRAVASPRPRVLTARFDCPALDATLPSSPKRTHRPTKTHASTRQEGEMPGLDVTALFEARGDAHYGEAVTQRDHALQCATLASRAGSDDELILAALLHDLAHLVTPEGRDTVERHHGHIGAALVRPFVPPRVAWIIEHHVAAKRYLCAVDPHY